MFGTGTNFGGRLAFEAVLTKCGLLRNATPYQVAPKSYVRLPGAGEALDVSPVSRRGRRSLSMVPLSAICSLLFPDGLQPKGQTRACELGRQLAPGAWVSSSSYSVLKQSTSLPLSCCRSWSLRRSALAAVCAVALAF